MSDQHDEMIARIAAQLRPLPDVDPAAKAGVLVAVATERERDRSRERVRQRRSRMPAMCGASVGACAITDASTEPIRYPAVLISATTRSRSRMLSAPA